MAGLVKEPLRFRWDNEAGHMEIVLQDVSEGAHDREVFKRCCLMMKTTPAQIARFSILRKGRFAHLKIEPRSTY